MLTNHPSVLGSGGGGSSGGAGSLIIKNNGSTINTATILDFTTNLSVSDAGGGVASISASGGGGSSYTEVLAYANLPVTVGTPAVGTVYLVQTSTGTWILFTKKEKGLWRRTGNAGALTDWTYLGDAAELTVDSTFAIGDDGDNTKQIGYQLAGATTSTKTTIVASQTANRSVTLPDATDTLVGKATTDVLTNKSIDASQLTGSVAAARMPALTGDVTTSAGAVATTLATVNSNVGSFGSATAAGTFTVNGKGLITAAASTTVTPAVGSITGLGTGVGAFLATPSSANLATAVTDETGSGALVFATSPTFVTPTLGAATATTVNKVTLTAPATGSTLTVADGKILTAANSLTLSGTDSSSIAFGGGGTVAYTANKLDAFAATTSAELKTVISDETGTGALVFATSPTLVTPACGTPSSINLTNATAVPAGQVVGVIPIANLAMGTPTGAKYIRDDGTLATPGGSGTVTATGGSLTANSVVLGAGTTDTKVVAGIITDGTSKLTLGVAGGAVGSVDFKNATSGTVTLAPVTGALGTVTLSLPAATGTLLSTAAAVTVAQGGTGLATLTANNVILGNGTSNPTFVAPSTSGFRLTSNGTTWQSVGDTYLIEFAASDETTAITAGNSKFTTRVRFAGTLTAVRSSVTTAPTGSTFIVDVNKNGTTVLSTKLSIDASEKTSVTAASAAVISVSSFADDDEITVDFDQVGSTIAGAGAKIALYFTRT